MPWVFKTLFDLVLKKNSFKSILLQALLDTWSLNRSFSRVDLKLSINPVRFLSKSSMPWVCALFAVFKFISKFGIFTLKRLNPGFELLDVLLLAFSGLLGSKSCALSLLIGVVVLQSEVREFECFVVAVGHYGLLLEVENVSDIIGGVAGVGK